MPLLSKSMISTLTVSFGHLISSLIDKDTIVIGFVRRERPLHHRRCPTAHFQRENLNCTLNNLSGIVNFNND